MIGETISHYEILEKLGGGGMGVVYKARDRKLDRFVAIKFLPPDIEQTDEERARFAHEAKAASALEHKNVCTIHEIDETPDGQTFIVMAFYEGESLRDRLNAGPLSLEDAVTIGLQMAEGLAAAHEKDIVHRDVKPANVMLAADGQAKLVDFGLAKLQGQTKLTRTGSTLGTIAYMAPEQARGEEVDGRADTYSLGAVLYEMLADRPPFVGPHDAAVLGQVLHQDPDRIEALREGVGPELARLVHDCLGKNRNRRPTSANVRDGLRRVLDSLRGAGEPGAPSVGRILVRPVVAVPAVAALIALAFLGYRTQQRSAQERWARAEAIPRISTLLEEGRYADALRLAQEAQRVIQGDPVLDGLIETASVDVTVTTDPPGAEVFYRPYLDSDAPWVPVGVSPIESVRMPWGHVRVRAVKEGYEPYEAGAGVAYGFLDITLVPAGDAPAGMVRVAGGQNPQTEHDPVEVGPFWIDRFEVTNQEYQEFVDAGGYEDSAYWPGANMEGEGTPSLSSRDETEPAWAREFLDATGRPGPATWEVGRFPEGEERLPVRGVSWYEAAAYCAFRGKRLPTLHHWWLASGGLLDVWAEVAVASNFEGEAAADVGSFQGIGANGTFDMAGNVAEWVSTEASGGARYVLGGSWKDPSYVYQNLIARDPLDRSDHHGIRCATFDADPGDPVLAPVTEAKYDFRGVEAVDDATFAQWMTFYEYDPLPLDARVEEVGSWRGDVRHEIVSYAAAYGGDRVVAHVFIPPDIVPPYQAVVFSPGATAYRLRSSAALPDMGLFHFILRSGRVFVYPVYIGSYERGYDAPARGPAERRQRTIWRRQDLNRTVDYLIERDDIDGDRLAYLGLSAGAEYGAVSLAVETRFRAAVWIGGGYDATHMQHEQAFEVPWNYAPRVTMPVLLINGRGDFALPVETAQRPLFEQLGTPPEDKRHVVLDGGHLPRGPELVREILDWLDTYLGPVGDTQ